MVPSLGERAEPDEAVIVGQDQEVPLEVQLRLKPVGVTDGDDVELPLDSGGLRGQRVAGALQDHAGSLAPSNGGGVGRVRVIWRGMIYR